MNPHAPKGGTLRQAAFGTYDNFNMVLAGWKGKLAAGVELIYDTLLTPSLDEPSAEYGLLAEAVNASGRFLVRHVSSAMPRMTGIELHRRLAESGYAIPTILITAYPDDSVRARALADGIICYLV